MRQPAIGEFIRIALLIQNGGEEALADYGRNVLAIFKEKFAELLNVLALLPFEDESAKHEIIENTNLALKRPQTMRQYLNLMGQSKHKSTPQVIFQAVLKAFETFEREFRTASLFQPYWQLRIEKNQLFEPKTQEMLDRVSVLRRNLWRHYEHLNVLNLESGKEAWGIISPELDINSVIFEAFHAEGSRFSHEFVVSSPELNLSEVPTIIGDRARMLIAMRELIRNAVFATLLRETNNSRFTRYSTEKHLVKVATSFNRQENLVCIEIQDFGIGMDEETARKMMLYGFSQSTPVDDAEVRFGGLGIGAPEALLSVHDHGGELTVQSVPLKGTTVSIEIPVLPLEF